MAEFFNIANNRLVLGNSGLSRVFLHISDTHISVVDELSTESERKKAIKQENAWSSVKEGFAAHFGEPFNESHRISTVEALEKIFAYAAEQKPDMLLLSGDILDYIHPAGIRLLRRKLDEYGGEYMFVPGNHEGAVTANSVLLDFTRGDDGLQVKDMGEFVIAGVDNSTHKVSKKQLSQLEELTKGDKPIILLMHMPICTEFNESEMAVFDPYFLIDYRTADESGRELIRLASDESSPIRAILCGHVHGAKSSFFAPEKLQSCASSGMIGYVNRLTVQV